MAYISTDRTGRYLFGASFGGDVISVNAISENGVVETKPQAVIKTGPHAQSILPDPSNRFVYVGKLGVDRLLQFKLNSKNGQLTPIHKGYIQVAAGTGPRHQAMSPDGRFLCVVSELKGTVTSFAIDQESGSLSQRQTVEGVPSSYGLEAGLVRPALGQGEKVDDTPRIWAADIHVTPDGRFLYISERTSSSISAFKTDKLSGGLSFIENKTVETQPRGFNFDPQGRFMIVSGEKSSTLGGLCN